MKKIKLLLSFGLLIMLSCGSSRYATDKPIENTAKILALGDSYTIGESVCNTCRFPEQLKDKLLTKTVLETQIDLKIIAKTGWTTTNLLNAIADENPNSDYDLVTLLIGVNNQYQHKPFSIFEEEFPMLVKKAITFGNGDKSNLIVVSIPDYAYTPYGQSSSEAKQISTEIDQYNNFAKTYCKANNITFVNITDITREGLKDTILVASDGLHPSALAYSKFVERIFSFAYQKIQ